MSKKLVGTICACTIMFCRGICSIGYVIGNSNFPWWLLLFASGIACAIISMVDAITSGIIHMIYDTTKSKNK